MNKEILRDKFYKFELIILYLYGAIFFINYEVSKQIFIVIILIMLIRKFYFKENLECGNIKIKQLLLFYIIGGILWNFMADFNYKAARAFLKLGKEVLLVFYIYPLLKKDKKNLISFLIILLFSYLFLFIKEYNFYKINDFKVRFIGLLGYSNTGISGMLVGSFIFPIILYCKNLKCRLLSLIVFLGSLNIIFASQSRGGFLGLIISIIFITFIKIDLKKLSILFFILFITFVGLKETPTLNRFKTSFNVERTASNMSNALRIEMWKNAIWRISQHPIRGGGTKQDEKLFLKRVEMMPENTKDEKILKSALMNNGFNDAHNMYLNILTDNGLFSLVHFIIFALPYFLILKKRKEEKIINFSVLGSFISFYVYGLTWSIWRNPWSPMVYWVLFSIMCFTVFYEEEKNENIKK